MKAIEQKIYDHEVLFILMYKMLHLLSLVYGSRMKSKSLSILWKLLSLP